MRNILIICTGNTCRSPMTMGLLVDSLAKQNMADVQVTTAGLAAVKDGTATDEAIAVMREVGIDISGHRTRWIGRGETEAADLVLCMTKDHKRLLEETGVPFDKIFVLEVSDPYGGTVEQYRVCRNELKAALMDNLGVILGDR